MSKASEWAARHARPTYRHVQDDRRLSLDVLDDGQMRMIIWPVGKNTESIVMTGESAIALARWILDTFEENA